MSALDDIRQRVEAATAGPWRTEAVTEGRFAGVESRVYSTRASHILLSETDGQAGHATNHDAEFIAHARTDVPALLGALDAADKKLSDRMNTLRDTADGFLQAVIDRDVHRDPELANRYDAYARQARAALIAFRAAVNDALEAK